MSLKNKKGFLLLEALLGILITSVLVMVVSSCVQQYVKSSEAIEKKRIEMNALAEEKMKEMEVCPNIEETLDMLWSSSS